MAVHLERSTLLSSFVLIPCQFADRLITTIDKHVLPVDWRRDPAPVALAEIGDRWVKGRESAVLAVPSAVIVEEANFLLNPAHRDFKRIRIGDPQDFAFDQRLIK
jgi:RES domain-containing protein